MKSIITLVAAICLLQSCKFGENAEVARGDSTIIYRDTSINPGNAYSDLFLDSNAVASYLQQQKPDTNTATMLKNFYRSRNNQFAWFNSQGMTEEGRSFWSMYSNSDSASGSDKEKNDGLRKHLDSLLQKDSVQVSVSDSNYVMAELALTHRLVQQAQSGKGVVTKQNIYTLVPRKKMDPMQLADSVLNRQQDSTALASNQAYSAMRRQLSIYYDAAKNGGWQPVSAGALKKGAASPAVKALKKRLQATNDYVANDTTDKYSDSLVAAVKDVQQRFGLAPTGNVNDSLVAALKVPAQERIQQILLNMNRLKWMQPVAGSNRIEVNIPSQMLYAYEGSNRVLEMPVIVGKEGTSTVAFNGSISQLVFNPTWNLPESIVKNEIIPAMKNDPGYLKKKNMEIVRQNDSVPVIKQLPGKDNPLGKVKFLFPNSFDIYLHDTPDKALFKKNNRALSHGCIRVADAQKLAQYLLREQKDWTPEKISAAMNGKEEQTVKVNNPAPVQISYLSSWVDVASGKMHFRNDINGRDKQTLARLFTTAVPADVATANADSTGRVAGDTTKNASDVAKKPKGKK